MGLDGGTIPTRTDLLRRHSWRLTAADGSRSTRGGAIDNTNFRSSKPETLKEAQERRRARLSTCAITGEPLKGTVRVCRRGNLYNHEALVEFLLKDKKTRQSPTSTTLASTGIQLNHIRSLKRDTFVVRGKRVLSDNPKGSLFNTDRLECWQCPLTNVLADGKRPFVALKPCGHIFSHSALLNVYPNAHELESTTQRQDFSEKSQHGSQASCMLCGIPFNPKEDVVKLLEVQSNKTKKRSKSLVSVANSSVATSSSHSEALVRAVATRDRSRTRKPKFPTGVDVLVLSSNKTKWNKAVVVQCKIRKDGNQSESFVYVVEYDNGHMSRKTEAELRSLAKMRCPKKHSLTKFLSHVDGFSCDVCRRVNLPEGHEMYGCRNCDWDACENCFRDFTIKAQERQLSVQRLSAQGKTKGSKRTNRRSLTDELQAERKKQKLLKSLGGRWTS